MKLLKAGDRITIRPRSFGERLIWGTEGKLPIKGGETGTIESFGAGASFEVRIEGHGLVTLTLADIL